MKQVDFEVKTFCKLQPLLIRNNPLSCSPPPHKASPSALVRSLFEETFWGYAVSSELHVVDGADAASVCMELMKTKAHWEDGKPCVSAWELAHANGGSVSRAGPSVLEETLCQEESLPPPDRRWSFIYLLLSGGRSLNQPSHASLQLPVLTSSVSRHLCVFVY